MREAPPAVTVIVLAGGEAKRLPGKLFMDAGDLPLLVRVYRNVSAGRATLISCKGALPYEIDLLIDAPAVVDRWPLRGPLSGLLSAIGEVHTPWVMGTAGDAPFIDAALVDALAAAIEPGDEAVVPRRMRDGEPQLEPLAALYSCEAFLREGLPVLSERTWFYLHAVIDRLQARFVDVGDVDDRIANVNTPADYEASLDVIPSLSRDSHSTAKILAVPRQAQDDIECSTETRSIRSGVRARAARDPGRRQFTGAARSVPSAARRCSCSRSRRLHARRRRWDRVHRLRDVVGSADSRPRAPARDRGSARRGRPRHVVWRADRSRI